MPPPDFITFTCAACRRPVSLERSILIASAGKEMACPHCGAVKKIPPIQKPPPLPRPVKGSVFVPAPTPDRPAPPTALTVSAWLFFVSLVLVVAASVGWSVFWDKDPVAGLWWRVFVWVSLYWSGALPFVIASRLCRSRPRSGIKKAMLVTTLLWVTLTVWQCGYSFVVGVLAKELSIEAATGLTVIAWAVTFAVDTAIYVMAIVLLVVIQHATKAD